MSGPTDSPTGSPTGAAAVQEVQARFPNDAALQDALAQLGLVGYDRSDFSLPEDQVDPASGALGEDQGVHTPKLAIKMLSQNKPPCTGIDSKISKKVHRFHAFFR